MTKAQQELQEKEKSIQIGAKEQNLLKEVEEKLPGIETKLRYMNDMAQKVPRIEDFVTKLSGQLKEFNPSEIMQKLLDLDENKADKSQLEKQISKVATVDMRVDDFSKVIALLDRRNGSDDGGILNMIKNIEALNMKLFENEKEFKELRKIVKSTVTNPQVSSGTTVQITEGASI